MIEFVKVVGFEQHIDITDRTVGRLSFGLLARGGKFPGPLTPLKGECWRFGNRFLAENGISD